MPTHEEIAVAAYHLWEVNSCSSDAVDNWLEAERILTLSVSDDDLMASLNHTTTPDISV